MKLKEFNQQKDEILELLGNPFNLKLTKTEWLQLIADKVNHLQPSRPTCSSCNYIYRTKHKPLIDVCTKLVWDIGFEPTKFGCNQHSDYDGDLDDNS